jgi:putative phosphoribosyl transferase
MKTNVPLRSPDPGFYPFPQRGGRLMQETRGELGEAQRVSVPVGEARLQADLTLPPDGRGVVVFPHGRGTPRAAHDPVVAARMRPAGLGTLFLDLLTEEEADLDARKAAFRFDLDLLAARLAGVTDWLAEQPATRGLPVGYFASGHVAAAAFLVAAERPGRIGAVVSQDGLPDLVEAALPRVEAPTLLLVSSTEESVLGLNSARLDQLGTGAKQLVLVPAAVSLLEESGDPEEVARLAAEWFAEHLTRPAGTAGQRSVSSKRLDE